MIKLYKIKNKEIEVINSWNINYREEIYNQPESNQKTIVEIFLDPKFKFDEKSKKKIMQSLRHFDEVSISNELYDCLYELEDYDYFGIADPDLNEFTGVFSMIIDQEV